MEQGIANTYDGVLQVNIHSINGSFVAYKTWQQIKDAQFVTFIYEEAAAAFSIDRTYYYIMNLSRNYSPYYNTSKYTIILRNELSYSTIELTTDDPDGYPSEATDDSGELPK